MRNWLLYQNYKYLKDFILKKGIILPPWGRSSEITKIDNIKFINEIKIGDFLYIPFEKQGYITTKVLTEPILFMKPINYSFFDNVETEPQLSFVRRVEVLDTNDNYFPFVSDNSICQIGNLSMTSLITNYSFDKKN